jgi:hypothetical protein
MWPKAAISSAELKSKECSARRPETKLKQRALMSEAAWTAGTGGTRRSMAFAERPRVKGTEAVAPEAEAEDDAGGAGQVLNPVSSAKQTTFFDKEIPHVQTNDWRFPFLADDGTHPTLLSGIEAVRMGHTHHCTLHSRGWHSVPQAPHLPQDQPRHFASPNPIP